MKLWNSAQGNDVHGIEKAISKIVLTLIICIICIPLVQAISINVNSPEFITEGQVLNVNFTASNYSGNLSQFIFRNSVLVSTGPSYSWQTGSGDSGTYAFRFVANTSTGHVEQTKNIEVLDEPMSIIINTPDGVVTNPAIRISATPSLQADQCSYSIDGTLNGNLNEGTNEWFKVLLLSSDGIYNLSVDCDAGTENAKNSIIFILDTTEPTITSKSPEGSFTGTPVQLDVNTNENSFCKYSKNDLPYAQMENTFSQTGGKAHIQIVNIFTQGDTTYYLACTDRHGNAMINNEELTFHVNLRPTAKIAIEGDNDFEDIIRDGNYQVKITTSEPVIEPGLSYELSNRGTKTDISLEGDGTRWEGFMSVPDNIDTDIGTFIFSAKDLTDLSGSEVTSGKIFLVDTRPPEPVENVKISVQGLDIKIEWLYDGEAIDDFYIYRDTESGVDKLDKWGETPEDFFLDKNALLGQVYYYKIAPVDKAGNVGPLTDEVSMKVEMTSTENKLDPELLRSLNASQELLSKSVWDIEQSIRSMEDEADIKKIEIISKLDLLETAKQSRNSIQVLIKEIDKLKLIGLTGDEIKKRIEVFLQNADEHAKKVVNSISVLDSTRQDQFILEEDLDEVINEVLVGLKLSAEQRLSYNDNMRKLQDKANINLEAITARIYYMETAAPKEITLIHKKVLVQEPVEDAIIVENIPKTIARRVNEIKFIEDPIVLRPDPIVKWEQTDLTSKDIYYYVEKIVDLTETKNTKTIILERPKIEAIEEITGLITEPVVEEESGDILSKAFFFLGLIVMMSLAVYYVFYVKEINPRSHSIMPSSRKRIAPIRKIPDRHHPLHSQVRHAHNHADDVKYQQALMIYKDILKKLDKEEKLDKKTRKNLNEETDKLYKKLMIVNNIDKAHEAIDKKSQESLKKAMMEIKRSYEGLGEDTELAKHARKSYSYFLSHLKKMHKEEFFKNLQV